ncbi:sensor histidine kinase [Phytohabitans aurantiacus]|nr:sensor histidine kinase [Phytohabitans aurantiacus]
MSTESASVPMLAALAASRAQREAMVRWLRPLIPLVMVVVVWAVLRGHPRPGLSGRSLAVSLALAGFVLAGLGALATMRRLGRGHLAAVAGLLAVSTALAWLQPDGVAIAGVFLGLSLLAPRSRGHVPALAIVVTVVILAFVVAAAGGGPVTTAALSAITLGAFYGMMVLAVRFSEANRMAERLLVELTESRAAQARAAGLAERQRLAREMHDVLAHALSGLMLQLEAARMLAAADPGDPRLRQAVDRAHQLGRTGLIEARRAIGTLRDDELPGPERLAGLAAQFERDRRIPCELTVAGTAYPLGSEARLALYRVAQEALTNIGRHAHPDRVELRVAYEPSRVRLVIEDFAVGDGPTTAPPAATGGYGLTGMRERAELLGGTLAAGPTSAGFRVALDLPR